MSNNFIKGLYLATSFALVFIVGFIMGQEYLSSELEEKKIGRQVDCLKHAIINSQNSRYYACKELKT